MISEAKSKDSDLFNGLLLSYPEIDFLVNRDYIFASITLEKSIPINMSHKHINSAIKYKDSLVAMIDFAPYLQELFHFIDESKSNVVLIIAIDSFNYRNQQAIRKLLMQQGQQDLSDSYIALKAGHSAQIHKTPFNQLSLTPNCLRKSHWHAGLLGVRFLDIKGQKQQKIQYLVDIERIVFHQILNQMENVQTPTIEG
ncbi:MAG: hypothetical protein K0S74_1459 [Chlamydiales bacterium]|jgi:hypothetical protein|nr:hypothetical protein [Chlamydiales bacterium]